jgi:hypothetical protein
MFQLAFHLPYYAWRTSPKALEDHRRDTNATPLRQSLDVSFLNSKSTGSSSFLYEAQISCIIAGTDECRWVAYCFVDTYFEAEEAKEKVQSYHEDSLVDEGMFADPFTFGERDADDPIQKPREYFLEVFRVRIDQVKCEWEQVVAKVQESIRKYVLVRTVFSFELGAPGGSVRIYFKFQSTRYRYERVVDVSAVLVVPHLVSSRLTYQTDSSLLVSPSRETHLSSGRGPR